MGSFCTSKPAVTQTQQKQSSTQTYTPDPKVAEAGTQVLDMAQDAAGQPFQMPAAPVAEFNPFQQQGFNQIQGMQGGLNPYFDQAKSQMTEAGQPVSESDINSYLNPYSDAVLANMKKYVFDPQRVKAMGAGVQSAGGVGAERLALTSQNLDKTQADALAGAMSGFYTPAMQQAQRAKEMAMQSATGWANLGLGQQTGNLQGTQALMGAGSQQQQLEQAKLMSPYQQRLAEIAYPMQQTAFLGDVTGAMSNVFKGTQTGEGTSSGTTTQQAATPSLFNQIAGLGMAGAGLAMGYPGGLTSMFGGGGGGYIPTNTPYLNANYAPFGQTYFPYAARGGAIKRASGGSVSPYDIGRGYFDGGDVDYLDPISQINNRFLSPWAGSGPRRDIPRNTEALENYGATLVPQQNTNPFANIPEGGGMRTVGSMPAGTSAYDMFNDPGVGGPKPVQTESFKRPVADVPLPLSRPAGIPEEVNPPRTRVAVEPQLRPIPPPQREPAADDDPSLNIRDLMMPSHLKPYPGAADRNWGQQMARSPWMALTAAGAKMMQSTQSGLGGLGAGVEAGVGHLDQQRKSLQGEEAINQRAEALYRQSKAELDKYTKMTPYQKAVIDSRGAGKYRPTGMTTEEGHPILYNDADGSSINGVTGEPVAPGTKLIGKPGGRGETVPEMKRRWWLDLHPGDQAGALQYANGKTQLNESQITIAAARNAQQDAAANITLFNPADREAYVAKQTEHWRKVIRENNYRASPAGQ